MAPLWDKTSEKHIRNLICPDGRNAFESTSALAQNILEKANIRDGDTVIDIGCGRGNITAVKYSVFDSTPSPPIFRHYISFLPIRNFVYAY